MLSDLASNLAARAARHAALGDPTRLAMVDELAVSDRSPTELGSMLRLTSNLLAHHLDVLERVGLISRSASAGDGRRKYVRLRHEQLANLTIVGRPPTGEMVFVCSRNSARSQLAAAVWTARTGRVARSAGTDPAAVIHPGAVAAARRAGLPALDGRPKRLGRLPRRAQVVTVCDLAHEELPPDATWWHWSIPDPVEPGTRRAFDDAIAELERRVAVVAPSEGRST
jgi:ArsR family transcriptional regulator, arsenate/arsenite/antimonite-responsive transcriptional repressor / arsenate reductase (thioredoxin)